MAHTIETALNHINALDELKTEDDRLKEELEKRIRYLYLASMGIIGFVDRTDPEVVSTHDPYPRRVTDPVSFESRSFRLREAISMVENQTGETGLRSEPAGVFIDELNPVTRLPLRRLFHIHSSGYAVNWHDITLKHGEDGFKDIEVAETIVDYIDKNL